jgi:hypothetical protein
MATAMATPALADECHVLNTAIPRSLLLAENRFDTTLFPFLLDPSGGVIRDGGRLHILRGTAGEENFEIR